MLTDVTECKVPPISLYAPSGEALPLTEVLLRLDLEGEQLVGCRLEFELPHHVWERVDQEALFHLDPDVRGPCFGGGFEPGIPIEIEARLQPSSLPLVSLQANDVYEAGVLLMDAAPGSELVSTESWYALVVKQRFVGPVKTGFVTQYRDEGV